MKRKKKAIEHAAPRRWGLAEEARASCALDGETQSAEKLHGGEVAALARRIEMAIAQGVPFNCRGANKVRDERAREGFMALRRLAALARSIGEAVAPASIAKPPEPPTPKEVATKALVSLARDFNQSAANRIAAAGLLLAHSCPPKQKRAAGPDPLDAIPSISTRLLLRCRDLGVRTLSDLALVQIDASIHSSADQAEARALLASHGLEPAPVVAGAWEGRCNDVVALGLSTWTRGKLGDLTLDEILRSKERDLLALSGFDERCLHEVKRALWARGLHLAPEAR